MVTGVRPTSAIYCGTPSIFSLVQCIGQNWCVFYGWKLEDAVFKICRSTEAIIIPTFNPPFEDFEMQCQLCSFRIYPVCNRHIWTLFSSKLSSVQKTIIQTQRYGVREKWADMRSTTKPRVCMFSLLSNSRPFAVFIRGCLVPISLRIFTATLDISSLSQKRRFMKLVG